MQSLGGASALHRGVLLEQPLLGTWQSDRRKKLLMTKKSFPLLWVKDTFSGSFLAGFQGNSQCEIFSEGLLVVGKRV